MEESWANTEAMPSPENAAWGQSLNGASNKTYSPVLLMDKRTQPPSSSISEPKSTLFLERNVNWMKDRRAELVTEQDKPNRRKQRNRD